MSTNTHNNNSNDLLTPPRATTQHHRLTSSPLTFTSNPLRDSVSNTRFNSPQPQQYNTRHSTTNNSTLNFIEQRNAILTDYEHGRGRLHDMTAQYTTHHQRRPSHSLMDVFQQQAEQINREQALHSGLLSSDAYNTLTAQASNMNALNAEHTDIHTNDTDCSDTDSCCSECCDCCSDADDTSVNKIVVNNTQATLAASSSIPVDSHNAPALPAVRAPKDVAALILARAKQRQSTILENELESIDTDITDSTDTHQQDLEQYRAEFTKLLFDLKMQLGGVGQLVGNVYASAICNLIGAQVKSLIQTYIQR